MNEELDNNIDNATPIDGGSISPSVPTQVNPNQEEPKLSEENRRRLTNIVREAVANKETDETINSIVKSFKNKYGVKSSSPAVQSSPKIDQPKPSVNKAPEQPISGEALQPKIDSNQKEALTPQIEIGEPKSEGIAPERPTTYQGLPIQYGETDDSGVVDFGNGIALPVSSLPKDEKPKPTIQIGEYISSLGPDGKQPEDITGQVITKDAENKMYQDWQTKGWGKIVKFDETSGRAVFAPNEEGRNQIKKVYEERLGYDKPIKAEANEFSNYISDIQKKYGVLLTEEERSKLTTKEGRDSLEIELQAKQLVKQNPSLSYDQAVSKVANEYQLNNNERARDLATNFFTERLTQMRWGRNEDNSKEAEWIKQTMGNQDMIQQFGRFLQSDDGKMYATSTNKFLSTLDQKSMKDVVNSFFQYMGKENMINTDANVEQFKNTQAQLLNSAKSGDAQSVQLLGQKLQNDGQNIRNNDTQSQNLFLQQQAVNEVFTEANYWEDKAGEYYGDVENGKRTVENVLNGSALMATNAIKRTAGGVLSVFLSPMAMMGGENKQDYYDLVRALGKPLEMKGVKLHDAFYTQEVGHDNNGNKYVRLNDGKVYQRNENGELTYLSKDKYDPRDITFDKTEHEWTASGIANAVQSFGWDLYMANGIGNAITKPISALSEYAAISNATKNLATAGKVIGEESTLTSNLANFTRAMRSPHTATNAGFFAQMYQDNLIKAKDAGIDSELGASLYATLNSAFDSFLISKVVPEFKLGQLNNEARSIVRNLAENKMASASQGLYNFLKETAPNMAHTYLTMLAIETKTKLTDQNLNELTDSHFNVDNSESIFTSSAKGALPLVLFSLVSKSPMMLNMNKGAIDGKVVDLSKMDKDELIVSLARQGDHIFPMLKNEAQNAYFESYRNEVENIAEKVKNKQDLFAKIPNYEKFNDSDLTKITKLMEEKQYKEAEMNNADSAFKAPIKEEIKNIDTQIQNIANGKEATNAEARPEGNIETDKEQTNNGETKSTEKKVENAQPETKETRTEQPTEETKPVALSEEAKTEVGTPREQEQAREEFSRIDLSESLGINKANDFLDNLDKKLGDFGKENLGINIPVTVLRGAVGAMRGAVKTAKFGADVISAGLNHVRSTAWYQGLSDKEKREFEDKGLLAHFDDIQNKRVAESVVKSETVGKENSVKSQVRESSGQTDTSKKITLSEKTLLGEKFKNLQKGFKTGSKEVQQFKKEFIDQLKTDIKGLGKEMNQSEMNTLLNQVGKINKDNIVEVETAVNKVIERIEARQDRKEMSSLKKQLKNLGKSKGKAVPRNIRDLAQDATIIDERYLSPESKEEYKQILGEIRGAFRPNSSDLYKMVDEAQAMKKLFKLYEEADRARTEELAKIMGFDAEGLTNKEIKDLWSEENADAYAESLAETKQKIARDAFVKQAEYAKIGLESADITDITNKEKQALKVLKELDFKTLPLEMIKQYVKIADNIVVNKDFSNAGAIVAKVKADKGINELVKFIDSKGINPKKIDRTQTGNSFLGVHVPSVINPLEWVKAGVDYMTTLNVYMDGIMGGPEGGAKLYNDTGFFDMSNARVRATVRKTNFDDYYQGTVDKLAKSNPSITEGKEVVKRSIFATLLQADRESRESMDLFKKSYIEKSIKSLEAYSANKNAETKIKILQETLDTLKDVSTKEELIDYLKTNEKDNYKLLRSASDYFLRHTQEFSDNSYFNHGERFDPRTAEDFYLPLSRSSLINKSMRTKVDEVKGTVASSFNRPSQAMSGSVFTRERLARLQESETINFDFDSMISNKYGEQVYDIESAQDILRMKSALTHPEMKRLFGPTLASLTDKALDKIAIDSGVAMNSTTEVEKNIIKVERTIRKIASVNALGGVDQYLKQYPSVLIGAGIRLGRDAGLLSRYMFMDKSQVELLNMSSIRLRGEAEAGIKRVSDDVKFTELSVKEKNDVEKMASKLAKGLGIGLDKARELSMYSLRKGDTNAATTTFLAYYHSYLLKHGVKESDIDMRLEHAKVENDPIRKDAFAYAQHMINTTQTSSDLSEGSKMATSPHVMAKIMSGVLIPFSSFSNNAMVRLAKAVGNINRGRKENMKEVAASLTEIIAFQSIKALAIAPAATIIGNIIFGGDKKDEEDVIDWEFQINKAVSGVIGDLNPTPDSFDIDAVNYMVYLKNRDRIKEQIGWEGDFSYRDYDVWRKKTMKGKDVSNNKEIPYHFYRFGDQDGWDIANGSKSDIGMYDIPMKQAERTVEAWDVFLDKKTEGYNAYGKKETFDFGNEHDNLLLFYTLYETAATIGLSDATSRRIIEREYDKIKKQSKEKKAKKSSSEQKEKSDDYSKL